MPGCSGAAGTREQGPGAVGIFVGERGERRRSVVYGVGTVLSMAKERERDDAGGSSLLKKPWPCCPDTNPRGAGVAQQRLTITSPSLSRDISPEICGPVAASRLRRKW